MPIHQPITLRTSCGTLHGLENEDCRLFLGVPFAKAARFEYAVLTDQWENELDATEPGPGCPQNRAVHEHLEHPTRRFYRKEFREGYDFEFVYDEDCLNLNIYTPKDPENCPVILFFYGGGFDSGLNSENTFNGTGLAKRGIITVFANYRVGVLGYFTHDEIQKKYGRDGNFGLDDQFKALLWVRSHIADFGGDPENLTIMGQSAGAISVQYLVLNPAHRGLFRRAAMMSGAGLFPKFALPKKAADTHEYWLQFMKDAGCDTFEAFQRADLPRLFDAVEQIRSERKDSVYHTMPVVDGELIPGPIGELMKNPLPVDYLLGYSNNDMYAPILAKIGNRFGSANGAYIYYFDLDAPGDGNAAFHASDLRYVFETLDLSWRPYGRRDHEAASELADYLSNFARTGDPNGGTMPTWKKAKKSFRTDVLHISPEGTSMGHAHYLTMTKNFLTKGDPKA